MPIDYWSILIFLKIIIYNFPTPEADYAILPLISIGILTSIPLYTALIIKKVLKKKREKKEQTTENETESAEVENLNTLEQKDTTSPLTVT
jgi:hypothetical protein